MKELGMMVEVVGGVRIGQILERMCSLKDAQPSHKRFKKFNNLMFI